MESYTYEATTKEGNVMKGTSQAVSERFAIDQIQDVGYFRLNGSRAEKEKAFDMDALPFLRSRVTEKDIMTFTYQLGVLLDAGFTLDKALAVLLDLTEKKALKSLTKEILSHIRSGKSLSESLSKFPSVFPLFYVNMVKAGETGGFLEETISRMAVYLENSQALKEDIRSALIYPLVLSIVGGAAVVVLLTFVVPKFTMIFSDLGEALPLPTIILLTVSKGLIHYWWLIMLIFAGVLLALRHYFRSERGRRLWDNWKFKLPLFGKLYREASVSRFART